MGKSTISTGPFSIAMLNYQRVNKNGNSFWSMYKNCKIGLKLSHLNGKNCINYVYIIVPWVLFHMISKIIMVWYWNGFNWHIIIQDESYCYMDDAIIIPLYIILPNYNGIIMLWYWNV